MYPEQYWYVVVLLLRSRRLHLLPVHQCVHVRRQERSEGDHTVQ
jgi:hypothetical protein